MASAIAISPGRSRRDSRIRCQDGGWYLAIVSRLRSGRIRRKEKRKGKGRRINRKEKEEHPKNNDEEEAAEKTAKQTRKRNPGRPARGGAQPRCRARRQPGHGLADVIVSQIGVEQQNIVTDPLLNAWKDTAATRSTDECRDFFATARRQRVANELRSPARSTTSLRRRQLHQRRLQSGRRKLPTRGCPALTASTWNPIHRPQPRQFGRTGGLRRHGVQHHA